MSTTREGSVTVIGAGLVGRGWAIVFARAGREVVLHDVDPDALGRALAAIRNSLADLSAIGLIDEPVEAILARIRSEPALQRAVASAVYVQECGPEVLEAKRRLFRELDEAAPPDAVLASSSSGLMTSAFASGLPGCGRCLVAHPVNPPHLVPLVELSPAPFTAAAVVERAEELMRAVGQQPILVRREIDGFILNRLQGALLNEAFQLAEEGYASPADIDRTVSYGLGLRWSFMGPFETIDLNAPGGLADYVARYGAMYFEMAKSRATPQPWSEALGRQIHAARRTVLPEESLAERQRWRDRRLMALAAHKARAASEIGE